MVFFIYWFVTNILQITILGTNCIQYATISNNISQIVAIRVVFQDHFIISSTVTVIFVDRIARLVLVVTVLRRRWIHHFQIFHIRNYNHWTIVNVLCRKGKLFL